MAKPQAPTAPPPRSASAFWLALGLVGACGLLLGATATYLLLLPRLKTAPKPATADPAAATAPLASLPGPDLTAGVPPAQADRNLGNFFYDQNDWAQAIHYYESAIRQGSDDADIRTDLGNAYRFSGRPADALAQYHTAQRLNPAHEFSLFNQGGLYFEGLNQPQKAVEIWNEYLRRFPQGQNAATARQFIARASGPPSGAGPLHPSTTATAPALPNAEPAAPSNAEVEKLLRLVPPSPTPDKP
jgi:tetratricopeptide (TPR) repeat protein